MRSPGRVEQLEDRPVAQRQRLVADRRGEEACDLVLAESAFGTPGGDRGPSTSAVGSFGAPRSSTQKPCRPRTATSARALEEAARPRACEARQVVLDDAGRHLAERHPALRRGTPRRRARSRRYAAIEFGGAALLDGEVGEELLGVVAERGLLRHAGSAARRLGRSAPARREPLGERAGDDRLGVDELARLDERPDVRERHELDRHEVLLDALRRPVDVARSSAR